MRTAVIPAAGVGTRFLPATKAVPKELLTVVDRPAIQHVVEEAIDAGLDEIIVVISQSKMAIERHFLPDPDLERFLAERGRDELLEAVHGIGAGARLRFVHQHEPRGLGDAIAMARTAVGRNPFAVLLPDHLVRGRGEVLRRMLELHREHGTAVVLLREVDPADIADYGCPATEPFAPDVVRIPDIVEKPDPATAPSNLAVAGRYVFSPTIFDHLDELEPGHASEVQLTDAMAVAAADSGLLGLVDSDDHWDIGQRLGYLHAQVELGLADPAVGADFAALIRGILSD